MLRRIAAGLAMVGAATVLAAPTATADTVRTGLACQTGGSGWQEVFSITVNVPATVRQGDAVTVTGSVVGTTARAGARPAGYFNGSLGLQVGGAANAWVDVLGMTSPAAKDGDPYSITGGSGQITLNTVGTVTFKPFDAGFGLAAYPGYGFGCFDPDGIMPTAASIQVLPR